MFLLGFSQGACLATEFATRNARRWGGVVALTGGLIGDRETPRDELPSALAGGSHLWFIALVAVCLFVWRLWRNWKLSRTDPPTKEELEAVKEMRRTGSFQLSGGSSAVARHFERSSKTDADRNYGGTRNLHEATVVDSWRDDD